MSTEKEFTPYEIVRLAIELKKLPEFSSKRLPDLFHDAITFLYLSKEQLNRTTFIGEGSYTPTGEEGRTLAGLQNPQRRTAVLSAQVPYDQAIRKITGQTRIDRAQQKFAEFLAILPNLGDPLIPLRQLSEPRKGELPTFALCWCEEKIIPALWVETLSKYYRVWRETQRQEQYRAKGLKTAAKKRKSKI